MVQNGILSILIFCGLVRNEIRKFGVFFSSRKMFGTESCFFMFCGWARNGIPSVPFSETDRMNQNFYLFVFHGIISQKMATLLYTVRSGSRVLKVS